MWERLSVLPACSWRRLPIASVTRTSRWVRRWNIRWWIRGCRRRCCFSYLGKNYYMNFIDLWPDSTKWCWVSEQCFRNEMFLKRFIFSMSRFWKILCFENHVFLKHYDILNVSFQISWMSLFWITSWNECYISKTFNVLNVTFLKDFMFWTSHFWNISCFQCHIFKTFHMWPGTIRGC